MLVLYSDLYIDILSFIFCFKYTTLIEAGSTSCRCFQKVEELIPIYGMEWKSVITYTPEKGWINDPCGPIYIDETYHLYYQLQPNDYLHEEIAWGHATSSDLVNWHDEDVAIPFTYEQNILNGSAIYDEDNTSGFGESSGPIVVVYGSRFKQEYIYRNKEHIKVGRMSCAPSIAYSQDKGYTWNVYKNNPILYTPEEFKEESMFFRDPTIFRYGNKWVLVVLLYSKKIAFFYESNNLKEWTQISKFSLNTPSTSKEYKANWECPDIFEMKVQGQDETKWVFLLSLQNRNTDSVYYIIGHFDGTQFKIDNSQKYDIKRLDYGSDFFAAKTWNNVQNHRYIIGWVNDWAYAKHNSDLYRGGLSLVRELNLIKKDGEYKLIQKPVENIEKYVLYSSGAFNIEQMKSGMEIIRNNAYNFKINVKGIEKETKFSLVIRNDDGNYYIYGRGEAVINYNAENSTISIQKYFTKYPVKEHIAKLDRSEEIELSLFIDNNTLTLFCNNGETVFTEVLITLSEKRMLKLDDKIEMSTLEFSVIQKLLGRH